MRKFKHLLGATAAAIPLAIALIYPVNVTAQAQQRAAQAGADSSGPVRRPVPPAQPTPGASPQQRSASPLEAVPGSRPQPAGGYAAVPTTGLCSQGFAKVAETMGTVAGKQAYTQYTCEGNIPKCIAEKAAAEAAATETVAAQGGVDGQQFRIRATHKIPEYHCVTPPLSCLPKAQNVNANRVEVEVQRGFIGDKVNYRCRYVWNQG